MATGIVLADEADAREQQRVAALDAFGATLETLKDAAVRWRAQYEIEWSADYLQYNTSARMVQAAKREQRAAPGSEDEAYRQTADNITRPKVIVTAARLGDMLFPTAENNWSLDISKRPEVPQELIPPPPPGPADEQGNPTPAQPYTPAQLLEVKKTVARAACKGMEDTIAEQLDECQYDEVGRSTIFDACLYGTGVVRGPILKSRRYHTYGSSPGAQTQMIQSAYPCAEHVDLWSFFPQPSRCIEECEHAFRLHILPRRGVRALARQPGFDAMQVSRLLSQEPSPGSLMNAVIERGAVRPDANMVLKDRYTVWEYRGPMPKDSFRAFVDGLVMQGAIKASQHEAALKELEADQLTDIDCEVWFAQGVVIKMALSTLGPGELGYYVFNYEKNPNSIFGHGVAYLCRDDQHAANQLWHAMMLNSMMSAGPQIGVRKGALEAEGRNNTLSATKPRVWSLTNDVEDINKALSVFIIPNVTDRIMGLYERAKQNADEHTMTPLIAQGEATQAAPTSSGTAMLMNASNVVNRRLAKAWDDDITIPLIGAWVDWNMRNNPDPTIRGDYYICPKGASHLLIKDVQTQHLQFATQLFASNPMLAPYMKAGEFARANVSILDLDADQFLLTDEQVAEAQKNQPPSADVLKAQAAQATAQAAQARAQTDAQAAQAKAAFDRDQMMLNHQFRMADMQSRERIAAMQMENTKLMLMGDMAKMQSDERVSFQQMLTDLTKHNGALDLKQFEAEMKGRLGAEQIASTERNVDKEMQMAAEEAQRRRSEKAQGGGS